MAVPTADGRHRRFIGRQTRTRLWQLADDFTELKLRAGGGEPRTKSDIEMLNLVYVAATRPKVALVLNWCVTLQRARHSPPRALSLDCRAAAAAATCNRQPATRHSRALQTNGATGPSKT
jgi:ATP-dependent exoDNAse (exonuclease V) beta subunit